MDNGIPAFEELQFDDELASQCDEVRAIAKKDWFRPASVSLAKLDQVKAKVYNLGLTDARSLRATHRNPVIPERVIATATASVLSDLHAEPPLSTVSYQRAAWASCSETFVPEVIRKSAGNVGTKPTRPSSAKGPAGTRPPLAKKSRPLSAKDPLCPTGKKKTAALGVKGHRYDPTEKPSSESLMGRSSSSSESLIGWAGPPAGLNAASGSSSGLNTVYSDEENSDGIRVPSAPLPSPEPSEESEPVDYFKHDSLHLSLSLPSADADVGDEMDTDRLMEEANKYVQKQKEGQKVKFFHANKSSDKSIRNVGFGDRVRQDKFPDGCTNAEPSISNTQLFSDGFESAPVSSPVTSCSSGLAHMSEESEKEERKAFSHHLSSASEQPRSSDDNKRKNGYESRLSGNVKFSSIGESSSEQTSSGVFTLESSTSLGSSIFQNESDSSREISSSETNMPAGSHYQYLGPPKQEKRERTHPIFLLPENKPMKQQIQPHPPMDRAETSETTKPQSHSRLGVHIREDRNVTVDITPRNLGRKVPDKTSFKRPVTSQFRDSYIENRDSYIGRGEERSPLANGKDSNLEITAVKVRNQNSSARPQTPASTVTVYYDDDATNDGSILETRQKKRKSRGGLKDKDIATMVSSMGLRDDNDLDDPEKEMDIEMGDGEGENVDDSLRAPSAVSFSAGEKNYYDIARHQHQPNGDGPSPEEKENLLNFITVTTKTIEFDADRPKESIVKKILEVPLQKPREKRTPSRPKSAMHRPKSANLVMSDMQEAKAPVPVTNGIYDNKGFGDGPAELEEEERPLSRMGFVDMDTDQDFENAGEKIDTEDQKEPWQRPPSGKRRPLSAANKANRTTGTETRQSRSKSKENVAVKKRPSSASPSVGRTPSAVDIQRANAAVRAMRTEEEATSKVKSATASRCAETRKEYASYTSGTTSAASRHRASLKSSPPAGRARGFELKSKTNTDDEADTAEYKECIEIHDRLARYGIDVKPDTLERALFPPTGKTLYYELSSALPKSYSAGLLSHPRFWLPREYKNLKLAEKKLAMAELSLWRQKRAEERKAKLAAEKERGKKGKKNGKKKAGKKKLRRSQSVS